MSSRYPFPFLDAYQNKDKDFFFGRDEEIDALYELTKASKIVLLYGTSGTGKTSIIRSGLSKKLKTYDWLELYVRPGKNLITALDKALCEAGGMDFVSQDEHGASGVENLNTKIETIFRVSFKPIYFIFDQFEELFTLGSKDNEKDFSELLSNLLQVKQPVKIIISIREEYLGYFFDLEQRFPELLRTKLRIEPMGLDKIKKIIKGVDDNEDSLVDVKEGEADALAEKIFNTIKGSNSQARRDIDLPYLQVYLDRFYFNITNDEHRATACSFSIEALEGMPEFKDVLRDFLEDQVSFTAKEQELDQKNLWKILSRFATTDGTKTPLKLEDLDEFKKSFKIDDGTLRSIISTLVSRRVLRFDARDDRYEVSHDILALKIHEQRSEDEIKKMEVDRLITNVIRSKEEERDFFSEKQLAFIEQYSGDLTISKAGRDWIDRSKQHQNWKTFLIWLAITAIIGFGIFSFVQRNNALAALKEVARRDFIEINELILRLDYQGAWSRLQTTAQLGVYADSIAMKMAEPAFFYGEAGNQERAKGMLDTLAKFSNNSRMRQLLLSWPDQDSVRRRQLLRESIIALDDSVTYKTLTARYYPEMVFVQGGTFTMGCTEEQGEDCYDWEKPAHQVTLDDYWIAKTETTEWEWAVYQYFKEGDIEVLADLTRGNQPQMEISWIDAAKYADWLNTRNGFDTVYRSIDYYDVSIDTLSTGYRLPREAEWEYAARGGRKSEGYKYAGSDSLALVGWFGDNSNFRPNPVGQKQENELGLYDMSGNVWEWCSDWYSEYSPGVQTNPKGPGKGTGRVHRGGSWFDRALHCRVSSRYHFDPAGRYNGIGFRLARSSNQ